MPLPAGDCLATVWPQLFSRILDCNCDSHGAGRIENTALPSNGPTVPLLWRHMFIGRFIVTAAFSGSTIPLFQLPFHNILCQFSPGHPFPIYISTNTVNATLSFRPNFDLEKENHSHRSPVNSLFVCLLTLLYNICVLAD
jgi:hypothetical protein